MVSDKYGCDIDFQTLPDSVLQSALLLSGLSIIISCKPPLLYMCCEALGVTEHAWLPCHPCMRHVASHQMPPACRPPVCIKPPDRARLPASAGGGGEQEEEGEVMWWEKGSENEERRPPLHSNVGKSWLALQGGAPLGANFW